MASISKTQGIELLAIQQVASSSVVTSAAQDVSTKLAAAIFIHLGFDDINGRLTTGVEFRVEASAKSTGDDQWFPMTTFRSLKTQPVSEDLVGTISSGDVVLPVNSTSGLSVGNIILIKNPVIANSEFARIWAVTPGESISVIDPLTNSQTGSTVYTSAEMFMAQIELTAIGRIRLVCDANNTGRTVVVGAHMVTGDTIG